MTKSRDVETPLLAKQVRATPIEAGDAGLVFKSDGLFYLFNTFDPSSPDAITEQQQRTILILDALSIAVQHQELLDVLIDMANNPRIRGGEETSDAFRAKH